MHFNACNANMMLRPNLTLVNETPTYVQFIPTNNNSKFVNQKHRIEVFGN